MINLYPLHIVFEAEEPILMPVYKGSTLRGALGHALKRVVCVQRKRTTCEGCIVGDRCLYGWVFESIAREKRLMGRHYPHYPHPYVLKPPLTDKREFKPGDKLEWGLVLLGRAVEYLPFFVLAFKEMGERGLGRGRRRAVLKEVRVGEDLVYREGGEAVFHPLPVSVEASGEGHSEVMLHFKTPTRIRRQRRLVERPWFVHIATQLVERVTLLANLYGSVRHEPVPGLHELAKEIELVKDETQWFDWERYSFRQGTRMRMGGFVGKAWYRGNLDPFWPYLKVGEFVHVGKNASFGLGGYELHPCETG